MPEVVISNTSPIFYLHRLRLLDLLQELYQKIIVPKAVVAELETGRRQGEDVPEIDNYLTARKTHSQRALALGSRRELASVVLQELPNLWCRALAWWHIAQGNVGGGAVYKCASTSSTKIIRSLTT